MDSNDQIGKDRGQDRVRPRSNRCARSRGKSYAAKRLSISFSDVGPARRQLIQLNTTSMSQEEMLFATRDRISETVAMFYNADGARWFMRRMGTHFLPPERSRRRRDSMVWVPAVL
ncbi:hypothetical protein IE4872_PD02204 (plasmid) [Rhizobium gallicum]|uniref:Uncharacterized protein n=1 Tax=Rhizobium gallicum TaxID=56730 RepID=A0A1L5NXW3_9HYPH|nr:hypothetical protein IE4872_PD02204 [Rhizobium gallicum]